MRGTMIIVGSVTYAMKSRELLQRAGFRAYTQRTQKTKAYGCGYGIVVPQNGEAAVSLLKRNRIRILAVTEAD